MRKKLKQALMILLLLILIPTLIIVGINIHMLNFSSKYIVSEKKELLTITEINFQTVIVLGAYVYENGQPCPMLEDRLIQGLNTLESALTDKIILSGDHGTRGYDEVNAMKNFVFEQGIEKEYVFLDHAGFSTYDSIIRAKEIFNVESAVISTQKYHLTRAVYIARKSGIDAYGISADLRIYPRSEMTRYILREWLARTKDFFYVIFIKPKPTYLGDKIPITGGSDYSYDMPDDLD